MISLEKFEEECNDKELVSLVKKSGITLEKSNLRGHIAKVAVCIDISGSMSNLFISGKVSQLVKRLIPLGLQFDDDGEIDVFMFGEHGYQEASVNLSNYNVRLEEMRNKQLEGRTNYERAISLVDKFYREQDDVNDVPVYCIFVTDGDATDKDKARKAMKNISNIPVFFQFIALGADYLPSEQPPAPAPVTEKKGFFSKIFNSKTEAPTNASAPPKMFSFLCELDEMSGRKVDNANFFAIKHPTSVNEEQMYDLLMNEYPDFLKEAKSKGVLK